MGRMTLDEALAREGKRGGGAFLKDWKDDGEIVVWLHTKSDIWSRFTHPFPYIDVKEDKETRKVKRVLRSMRFGCLEADSVNEKRRFKDDVTGLREYPPVVCPLCLLIERLRAATDLPNETLVVNLPDARNYEGDPTPVEYKKDNVIGEAPRTGKSWMKSIDLRQTYLFAVVADETPTDGVRVADEAYGLGSSMFKMIKQQKESEGEEAGDPRRSPFAIKWVYNEKAAPSDKYTCFRFNKVKLTPEVNALIRGDLPDLGQYCEPGNVIALRAYVEEALTAEARKVVDIDALFAEAEKTQKARGEPTEQRRRPEAAGNGSSAKPAAAAGPLVAGRRRKVEDPKPAPVQTIPCDECQTPMRPDQTECTKCHAKYEIDSQATVPAEPTHAREYDDEDIPF
jgi:hypothetical protein